MEEAPQTTRVGTLRRVGLVAAATAAALLLAAAVTLAEPAGPVFDESYKSGPRFTQDGDIFTYTVVVANTGDETAPSVTLTDTLPHHVVPLTCTVTKEPLGTLVVPCSDSAMLSGPVAAGERVTVTMSVRVDAQTMAWPLVNTAHLSWDDNRLDLGPITTTVNPYRLHLPIIARNSG